MIEQIRAAKRFFESKGILISHGWLESCVSWYIQEHENNFTLEDLQSEVYEQWLLFDFRDVNVPALPPNITKEKKTIINKPLFLQLMSIVDISKPKLTQINNIRNKIALSNTSEENMVSGKRVLQLTLSDGMQEILGIECKPIQCLNLNLSPGLKIRLNPPITVRRGQILLEPNTIKILGGDVSDLTISNASENILAKALGLPLSEKPAAMQEMDLQNQTQNTQLNPQNNTNQNRNINEVINNYSLQSTIPVQSNSRNVQPKQKPSTNKNPLDMFDDDFDLDSLNKIDELVSKVESKNLKTPPSRVGTLSRSDFEDLIDDEDYDMLLRLDDSPPPKVIQKPVLTIEKLLKMKHNVNKGKFTISAEFKKIVKKLSMKNNKYSIQICIEDSSGEMNVEFDSEVVSYLIGYDPDSFRTLNNSKESQETAITADPRMLVLNEFRNKLVNLNSKMEILIESGQELPVVIKLI